MITAFLTAALTCSPAAESAVVGFWESETVSRGGIGSVLELQRDGRALSAVSVMVEFGYRVADGKLFLAEKSDAAKSQTEGNAYTIAGNTFVLGDGHGNEVRKTRLGGQNFTEKTIVGDWQFPYNSGGMAYERYTPDGRAFFRMPMTSQETCFTAANGTMTLNTLGPGKSMKFNVAGSILTLTDEHGTHRTYRRAEHWYPIDRIDHRPRNSPEKKPGV